MYIYIFICLVKINVKSSEIGTSVFVEDGESIYPLSLNAQAQLGKEPAD